MLEPSDRLQLEFKDQKVKRLYEAKCDEGELKDLKKTKLAGVLGQGEGALAVRKHSEMRAVLQLDGVYVDDPEVEAKFKESVNINVIRLEERLLQADETVFFKTNGELKLHNDILADEMTMPFDQAFEKTPAFQTKEQNAVLCDRINAYKKRFYRLDINIGRVQLHSFKDHRYFDEEQRMAQLLKRQFKEYETRVSLAMIPFLQERLQSIQQELREKRHEATGEEKAFLANSRKEV